MKDLTEGKEGRLIFSFALPMLIGNLFQQLYNIVDSIVVGRFIGKEALAAVGASFPIIFTLISLVIGIASGGTIIVSQYFGAKKIDRVKDTIGAALSTFVGQNIGANKSGRVKTGMKATFFISSIISIFVTGIVIIFIT